MADIHIPDEVIREILSRLPAKSLCRFRCVCKPWNNLTFDPSFTKFQLTRAIERNDYSLVAINTEFPEKELDYNFFYATDDGNEINSIDKGQFRFPHAYIHCSEQNSANKTMRFKIPSEEFHDDYKLLGSCNGVVCVGWKNHICLVNPLTREYKIVAFEQDFTFRRFMTYVNYYFGYDTAKEDYKLVEFVAIGFGSKINIYSLDDCSCFTISGVPYIVYSPDPTQSGVFINGSCHFVARHRDIESEQVIFFDFVDKVVRAIPRPDYVGKDVHDEDVEALLTVGVVGGQLALLKSYARSRKIEIWVETYGARGSWSKLLSTELMKDALSCCLFDRMKSRPLYFSKDGDVLTELGKILVMYDLKKSAEQKKTIATDFVFHGINCAEMSKIVAHVPSLVPLQSGLFVETVLGVQEHEKET